MSAQQGDPIDSVINEVAIEAQLLRVDKKLASLATTLNNFPKATLFQDNGSARELANANSQLSTVLDQLKVKNLELTNATKAYNLEKKKAADQAKIDAQAMKDQAAQELELGRQKILSTQAQVKEEQKLADAKKATAAQNDTGTFNIPQGSGQSGNTGIVKPASSSFIPSNENERLALALIEDQKALQGTKDAQKLLNDEFKAGNITQAEYQAALVNEIQLQTDLSVSISNTRKELLLQAKANQSIPDTISGLEARNARLGNQRDQISVVNASPQDIASLKTINEEIDKNNDLIRVNKDLLAQQKINIGNYPTSFGAAFKTLNTELSDIQGKLVSGNFKGAELDNLTAKFNVLSSATAITGKEFATVGQQQNAFKEAGIQLASVYGKNSDVFKTFASQVGAGNKEISSAKDGFDKASGSATKAGGIFQKVFSGLRTAANLIPGIGLSGIVLLLLDPIIALGANLIKTGEGASKAGRDFQELQEILKEHNDILQKSVDEYAKTTSNVLKLTEDIDLAKRGFLDKDKVVKEYNETMGKTTGLVTTLDEAEQKVIADGPDYIKLLFLKAQATAAYALAGEAAKKALTAQSDAEKGFGATEFVSTNKLNILKQALGFGSSALADAGDSAAKQVKKNADKLKAENEKAFASLKKQGNDLEEQAAALANFRGFNLFGDDQEEKKKKEARKSHEDLDRITDEFNKKDLEALAKFTKDQLTILKNKYKEIADDQNKSLSERQAALKSFYDVSAQLIANDVKAQEDALNLEINVADKRASKIKDPQKRADAEIAIEKYRVDKLATIHQDGLTQNAALDTEIYKDNVAIATQSFDKIQKLAEEHYKFLNDQSKIAQQNQLDEVDIKKDDSLLNLQKKYNSGLITLKQFETKRSEIEQTALIDQEKIDLKRLQDAEIIFETLYGFKNISLIKKAKDLEVKLNADANKEMNDQDQIALQNKKDLRNQLEDTFQSIVESSFEKEKEKNDAQLQLISDRSKAEIDAINASGLAQTEKDKRIMAIQKQADFQTQQIQKRQQQEDERRAKFEKAASIARIIQSTVEAVLAALGAKPYTPFNIAQAAIIGAIGAAQIATVIAQPIPHYKTGTSNAKKGKSVVGEEGTELMVTKHGHMFLSPPRPTLVDLAGGEQIFKHDVTMDMLKHSNMMHILAKVQNAKQPERIETNYNEKMYKELRSLNGKPPFIINVAPGFEATDEFKKKFKGY